MSDPALTVTFLGTGAPLSPGRATLGLLLTAPGCDPLLLDTCGGFEIARQLAAIGQPLADIQNIIVTHRHLDHAGGVPALLLANQPLAIHATPATQDGLDGLLAGCFPEWQAHPEVARVAVTPGERRAIGGFVVEFFPVVHRVETVAVRVTHAGRTVAYSADSIPCDALVDCARDADLFICDAFYAAGDRDDGGARARELMHPTAREAATMAVAAGVRALALVHLARYAAPANILAEAGAIYHGPLTVPDDGQWHAV